MRPPLAAVALFVHKADEFAGNCLLAYTWRQSTLYGSELR